MPGWRMLLIIGVLALLTPGAAHGQTPFEEVEAFSAVSKGVGDNAEMRLQQALCDVPASDTAHAGILQRFDAARARHLEYAAVLVSYMQPRRPSRQLRRQVAATAAEADRTTGELEAVVRAARMRVKGIPYYSPLPGVPMTRASNRVRSLYRRGGLEPERMIRELSPPAWKDVARVRSELDCTRM